MQSTQLTWMEHMHMYLMKTYFLVQYNSTRKLKPPHEYCFFFSFFFTRCDIHNDLNLIGDTLTTLRQIVSFHVSLLSKYLFNI